jgi:transcriptional regulator with XRE-family HTH domain
MESDPILETFGDRVRLFRKAAGLSQEDLADLAEMHRTYLSGIERGVRNVSLVNIVRLAKALKISPSQLMEGVS